MKLRKLFVIHSVPPLFSMLMSAPYPQVTNSRQSWIVQRIYNYNHGFNNNSVLSTELATKMTKMAVNAFSFYRGTAHLYYQDIKDALLPASVFTNAITDKVWIEGDMHMQNMGGLHDAKGNAVFDTNDFDEGYWGSYTWDLRRMAVAILLAAEENAINSADRASLVKNFVGSYAKQIAAFKGVDDELTFRLTRSNSSGVIKDVIQAADKKKRANLLEKYATVISGERKFQTLSGSLQPVDAATFNDINNAMADYINSISTAKRKFQNSYRLKDAALRLGAGTGSLGRYRYYLLMADDSVSDNSADVILEMKQESDSAVSIAAPDNMPTSAYSHNGERVAKTMKAMLNNADVFAGYTTMNGMSFFIRERSPYQEDFDYTLLNNYEKFNDAVEYIGKMVAKNHALADKDYDATLVPYSMDKEITAVINGDISGLKIETLNYALNYAAQVKQDYADFVNAKNSGAILY